MKHITIIGGGPAALMLATQLHPEKYKVTLYDKKKSVGRKFLVAGEGGLNLTYNESLDKLITRYHPTPFMDDIIKQFTNEDLRSWLNTIGVPTFSGSSNRVFPEKGLKPIEVLNKITAQLSLRNVKLHLNTKWTGWNDNGDLCFENQDDVSSDIVVFAMGGASWKVTGSDGAWSAAFRKRGIAVLPFRAVNCAFGIAWDKDFIAAHEGKPLKNIALTYNNQKVKGELVISKFGLEGNAIYALSQKIQEDLLTNKSVVIHLDLKPKMTADEIRTKYKNAAQSKITKVLKKDVNLDRTAIGILKHFSTKETFSNPDALTAVIKAVPIKITAAGPLDEAISSLGGIALHEMNRHLQFKKLPHTYAIGEMLDWYAPTGGYLLQGCFSMGFALARHLNGL